MFMVSLFLGVVFESLLSNLVNSIFECLQYILGCVLRDIGLEY